MTRVDLTLTSAEDGPSRSLIIRILWYFTEILIMRNALITPYTIKRNTLRLFGAHIGQNVIIKPAVRVKQPWKLDIGENSWIGERVWIDNFAEVHIGANSCVSQGAYLCTGNHDWSDPGMRRIVRAIHIGDGTWIGAYARVAPGTTVGEEAVVGFGAVVRGDIRSGHVYFGNPGDCIGVRRIRDETSQTVRDPARSADN